MQHGWRFRARGYFSGMVPWVSKPRARAGGMKPAGLGYQRYVIRVSQEMSARVRMYRVIPLAGIETKCHMSATCLSVSRGRGFHLSLRFNLKGTFEDCLIIIIIIIMTPQALARRRDVRSRVPGGLPNPYLTMAISEPQQERGSGADGSGADLVPEPYGGGWTLAFPRRPHTGRHAET